MIDDYFPMLLIGFDQYQFDQNNINNIADSLKKIIVLKRKTIIDKRQMLCSIHKCDECLALINLKYEWFDFIKVYEIVSVSTIKLTSIEKYHLKQIFAKLGIRKCREAR